MIELTRNTGNLSGLTKISDKVIQLSHLKGESVFMTDPEGNRIEMKVTEDGTKVVFTRDEEEKSIEIEERENGTKLYHISSDSTGLPSSHEIRPDKTEVVYFYGLEGNLQHFVEIRPNGDRVSTLFGDNGSIFSIEQKQIGGIVFSAWLNKNNETKEGMIWLHPDGEISKHGDESVIAELFTRYPKFFDGVCS